MFWYLVSLFSGLITTLMDYLFLDWGNLEATREAQEIGSLIRSDVAKNKIQELLSERDKLIEANNSLNNDIKRMDDIVRGDAVGNPFDPRSEDSFTQEQWDAEMMKKKYRDQCTENVELIRIIDEDMEAIKRKQKEEDTRSNRMFKKMLQIQQNKRLIHSIGAGIAVGLTFALIITCVGLTGFVPV